MPTITINPADPASINAALNTEWLLTNGLGGYAMGTVLGVNTRRYHGLLVAATKPPVGRIVALHSMIEQLIIPRADGSEEVIDLSTQQFGDEAVLHPNGWKHLVSFKQQSGCAEWTWKIGELELSKALLMPPGRNSIIITYLLVHSRRSAKLRVRPMTPLRDFHSLMFASHCPSAEMRSDAVTVCHDNMEVALTATNRGRNGAASIGVRWSPESQLWHHFAYSRDRDRGQDWQEDSWSAGVFEADLQPTSKESPVSVLEVFASLQNPESTNPAEFGRARDHYQTRRDPSNLRSLRIAASDFVVKRQHGDNSSTSVIAGYPWFGDWGRDTMISLPGLMLCTGRFDEARSTLLTFARSMKNGLIPNLFDDYGGADHYNTVDASLWFVHAVREIWKATSKPDVELLAACREIIAAYRRGTDFNIRMDPADSLIMAGNPSAQLTWMDAKRDNIAFTPRNGKPVEINSLWYNALRCLAEMTEDPRERDDLVSLSEKVAKSFREQFWWEERKCLHDVLSPPPGSGGDATSRGESFIGDRRLRPNQIFPVSLPYSPLTRDQQRAVVKIVGERLLTPFGLRTLDRDDPQYRGRYEGNLFDRDSAYHQGTVWPWLIGPYCEALLRVNDFNDDAKRQVRQIIQPLIDEMSNTSGGRCLNQIAEVYDGDPPHRPSGCPAQAWSVAEVLRIVTLLEPG